MPAGPSATENQRHRLHDCLATVKPLGQASASAESRGTLGTCWPDIVQLNAGCALRIIAGAEAVFAEAVVQKGSILPWAACR